MTDKVKSRRATPYDLNTVSRQRVESATNTVRGPRTASPYTLRREYSLSTLRAKTEKNEPS
jgi:hypothetical protein